MRTHLTTQSACPYCKHPFDSASHMDQPDPPEKDDLTVCLYCARILRFNARLIPQRISEKRLREIFTKDMHLGEQVADIVMAIKQSHGEWV